MKYKKFERELKLRLAEASLIVRCVYFLRKTDTRNTQLNTTAASNNALVGPHS